MRPSRALRAAGAAPALAALLAGCQEKLTAPGECPTLCPGGTAQVFEAVVPVTPALDSSFTGYVARGAGSALLVSSGLPTSEDRAILRFAPRPDSITVGDTARPYVIDSVALGFTILSRDTAVKGLRLVLYHLPTTIDSSTGFAEVDAQLADLNLIDSVPVPDSLVQGAVRTVFSGERLARVAIPPEAGGVLALGLRVAAPSPTGVRIAASAGGGPSFTTYITAAVTDTAQQPQPQIVRTAQFASYVSAGEAAPGPDLLAVGGAPSSRALLRFELPPVLRDSASIVRATLELIPALPVVGVAGDTARLVARGILADLGAKSTVDTNGTRIGLAVLPPALPGDTVRVDVVRLLQLWQGASTRPTAILLSLVPEAATFSRPFFQSSRSAPDLAPRLRIDYQLSFPFERP